MKENPPHCRLIIKAKTDPTINIQCDTVYSSFTTTEPYILVLGGSEI